MIQERSAAATSSLIARDDNLRMIERSGNVCSGSRLVEFLYLLMRDDLTPGVVEGLVRETESTEGSVRYCNGWLAQYAQDVATRLLRAPRPAPVAEPASASPGAFRRGDKVLLTERHNMVERRGQVGEIVSSGVTGDTHKPYWVVQLPDKPYVLYCFAEELVRVAPTEG